jgi:hypothetical protein
VLQVSSIGAALVLFCLAYFPTLVADYVPEDQWRAFRYSTPALSWKFRLHACTASIVPHYVYTGGRRRHFV